MGDTIIISVYMNPRKTQDQLESLMWYIRQFRNNGLGIIAAGDYNLSELELRKTAQGY
jgi:hypothetical protein